VNYRSHTKCCNCRCRFDAHLDAKACPIGGGVFKGYGPKKSASQSFTAAEVATLDAVLSGLSRRADLSVIARRPELTAIARKVTGMRKVIEANKAKQ
jgi:hypothetical protein